MVIVILMFSLIYLYGEEKVDGGGDAGERSFCYSEKDSSAIIGNIKEVFKTQLQSECFNCTEKIEQVDFDLSQLINKSYSAKLQSHEDNHFGIKYPNSDYTQLDFKVSLKSILVNKFFFRIAVGYTGEFGFYALSTEDGTVNSAPVISKRHNPFALIDINLNTDKSFQDVLLFELAHESNGNTVINNTTYNAALQTYSNTPLVIDQMISRSWNYLKIGYFKSFYIDAWLHEILFDGKIIQNHGEDFYSFEDSKYVHQRELTDTFHLRYQFSKKYYRKPYEDKEGGFRTSLDARFGIDYPNGWIPRGSIRGEASWRPAQSNIGYSIWAHYGYNYQLAVYNRFQPLAFGGFVELNSF